MLRVITAFYSVSVVCAVVGFGDVAPESIEMFSKAMCVLCSGIGTIGFVFGGTRQGLSI